MNPTAQQSAIYEAFATGENLVVEALAGTGKTTTTRGCSERTKRRGAYVVFNRKAAQEAKGKMPSHVRCGTSHSFAFGPVGSKFKARMDRRDRPNGTQAAAILDIAEGFQLPHDRVVNKVQLARLAQETVAKFCYTADESILPRHVPTYDVPGAEEVSWDLANYVVPLAERAWADLTKVSGSLFFNHDVYLKMWALSNPRIAADWIAVDEAQDTNPCLMGVVLQQDAQLIAVGDRNQAIYGWRGATDAMANFPAETRLPLSQSFRFGPAVADEANVFLSMLDAEHRIEGYDKIHSRVGAIDGRPDAVLCRTNAGVIAEALRTPADETYAIVGGTRQIELFAKAAEALIRGGKAEWHPDLGGFKSWTDVCDYADNESGGSDLRTLVNLIRDNGADEIRRIAAAAVDERRPQANTRVLTTAHKAKGGEWGKVRIASDFTPDGERAEQPLSDPEAMLAYVSVTRAQNVLDPSGLEWAKGVTA